MTGRLIVFEGVEGAGKSTQLARLRARLERAGVNSRSFREPGGTPTGDRIRAILLDPGASLDARTEALLFMASRAELVSTVIRPLLAAETVVLLDRFFLSTYAYQVGGRALPEADVVRANHAATGGLVPDLTVLLGFSAAAGLSRAQQRGPQDRMEQLGADFHQRVESAFSRFSRSDWQDSHPEAGPIVVVDASGTADEVEHRVSEAVAARIPELGNRMTQAVA